MPRASKEKAGRPLPMPEGARLLCAYQMDGLIVVEYERHELPQEGKDGR